jgi:effector-binding domain-containing protein
MRFFKILFVSVLITALTLLVILYFLPDEYETKRSVVIKAPAPIVYEFISNTEQMQLWFKFSEFLPSNLEQPGEFELGEKEKAQISYTIKHDKLHGTKSLFTLNETNGQTTLTWKLTGKFDFFYKWLRFFKDKVFAAEMDNSLSLLKSLAEKEADIDITFQENFRPITKIIAIRDTLLDNNPRTISGALGMALTELFEFVSLKNLQLTGPPMSIFIKRNGEFIFDAAVPIIAPNYIKTQGRIRVSKLPDGKVLEALYTGPYDKIKYAYDHIESYMTKHNLQTDGYIREEYLNDPVITPPKDLKTNIVIPVK